MDEVFVRQLVYKTITLFLPGVDVATLDASKHLRELGADSVERVEIIMALVDGLKLRVPLAQFADIPDVNALVGFLVEVKRRG